MIAPKMIGRVCVMKAKRGRPFKDDRYGFMRPLVEMAIEREGSLPKLCENAECLEGRRTIQNWLRGRGENETLRALPRKYGLPLMDYLYRKYKREVDEFVKDMFPPRPVEEVNRDLRRISEELQNEKDREIAALERRIASLTDRLARLKALWQS
jgi:hypothetical protein